MPNALPKSLDEIEKERPRRTKIPRGAYVSKKRAGREAKKAGLGKTSIYFDVKANKRRPPPVPEGTLEEIKRMDPDDPRFRHKGEGGKPHVGNSSNLWKDREPVTWKDHIRKEYQDRERARRAKVRKSEAVVVKAVQEHGIVQGSVDNPAENALVADEILDLDDWDPEELVRGYRRNRKGNFGKPPKHIPREVHAACWRRLVKIGDKRLKAAYLDILENLVDFARGYRINSKGKVVYLDISDKTQLQAMDKVIDRLVGKVPDTLKVQTEAPYEAYLADAVESIGPEEPQLIERTVTTINGQRVTMELEDGGDPALPSGDDEPRRQKPKKGAKRSPSSSKKKKTTKKKTSARGGSVRASNPDRVKRKKKKKKKRKPREEIYEGELVE